MSEEGIDFDSDSNDEDYQPTGFDNNDLSEEASGSGSDEPCSDSEKNSSGSRKRRKQPKGKIRKKSRNVRVNQEEEEKEEEKENSKVSLTEDDKKKRSDSLWADFLLDCGPPAKKSQPVSSDTTVDTPSEKKPPTEVEKKPPKQEAQKITEVLTFAGEEVKIEKTVTPESSIKRGRGGGGLSSVLSQIGKKGKLSTLEKSKLDWDKFKSEEGINEDLVAHNKGKNGYLERQDFLQRTDLRQFEIEKNMRASKRSLNR